MCWTDLMRALGCKRVSNDGQSVHPPPLIHSISPSKETFCPSPIFSKTLICRTLFVLSLFGGQIFTNAINFFPCFVHHPIDCHPPQSIPLHINISETKAIAHGLNIYVYLWALSYSRDSCKDYPYLALLVGVSLGHVFQMIKNKRKLSPCVTFVIKMTKMITTRTQWHPSSTQILVQESTQRATAQFWRLSTSLLPMPEGEYIIIIIKPARWER